MRERQAAMTGLQRFFLKTEIVFGPGMFDRLEAFRGQRIGIITDAFMVKSGMVDRVRAKLPPCEIKVFGEVVPEPPLQNIAQGARFLADFKPDAILALGGGSAIDAAKAILATLREMEPSRSIVMIAVPTTSGTGSEVTSYAIISEPERGIKHPLRSEEIIPDIALLDPELVMSVPPKVTADTGMDVITHALEAYVAREANDFSDAFAEKALALAFAHLPTAFANGNDVVARGALHNASCMAGIAFSAAGLGLNHGLAHAIGGRLHIPHGKINAMLLPLVIEYNAGTRGEFGPCLPAATRYAEVARRLGLEGPSVRAGVKSLAQAISRLNAQFGIPPTLRALGVDLDEVARYGAAMVQGTLADSCTASNPRKPTPDDVAELIGAVTG
ncbi:Iron-containing alcohol dehydrogenase [Rhodospirillum rubrum ATCC 11170]|uniref:Alcohol dehydrogenase 2 n=2 Tax=Rhodospirillum rubrum TaxID=1085 RepID=Q2RVZ0_RHORT|nr:Iron-containing alcohol dehydrogenase [Rhodospirillum rubrum ATCC 11170]MBK5953258.1 alcohol dehydrogenase [Rhodospirillum rubrum]HCF16687.1 alcohol dehydrogenase [Rhodospirillum rubrum]